MSKKQFGWGVLGAGRIASKFSKDLHNLDNAKRVAVGSRSLEKAQAFANEYGFTRAYGSYVEMLDDPEVDVVYVATPHPFHMDHTLLCLDAGKAVLCEKPLEVNKSRAEAMVDASRAENLFLMEAMWTRFLPVTEQVREWLADGRIGDVRYLSVDLGFRADFDPKARLFNPELAGGALLDVGVYTVAYASSVFGPFRSAESVQSMKASACIGPSGVDEQTAMLFSFDDGRLTQLFCAVRTNTPQQVFIQGTEGMIHIPDFWHATSATLTINGHESVCVTGEAGYHFEADEVMQCMEAGKTESDIMPLDETLAIAETLDNVRKEISVTYPME